MLVKNPLPSIDPNLMSTVMARIQEFCESDVEINAIKQSHLNLINL